MAVQTNDALLLTNLEHLFKLIKNTHEKIDVNNLSFYCDDNGSCEKIVKTLENAELNVLDRSKLANNIEIEELSFSDIIQKGNVKFFTHPSCGHCSLLKDALKNRGVDLSGDLIKNHKDLGDPEHVVEYVEELQKFQGNEGGLAVPYVLFGDNYDQDIHSFIFNFAVYSLMDDSNDYSECELIWHDVSNSYYNMSEVIGDVIDYIGYLDLMNKINTCYAEINQIVDESLGEGYIAENAQKIGNEYGEQVAEWIAKGKDGCGEHFATLICNDNIG